MRTASEIYATIIELRSEIEQLEASNKVTMSTDSWNTDWRDRSEAFTAARTSLAVAAEATTWMETRTEKQLAM